MNMELYNEARRKINNSLYAGYIGDGMLTRDVVDDYVADAAEYHDELNDFATNWESEVQDVIIHLCRQWKVEHYEEGA